MAIPVSIDSTVLSYVTADEKLLEADRLSSGANRELLLRGKVLDLEAARMTFPLSLESVISFYILSDSALATGAIGFLFTSQLSH